MTNEVNLKTVALINQEGYFIKEFSYNPSDSDFTPPSNIVNSLPETREGFIPKYSNGNWEYIENHVGKKRYSTTSAFDMVGEYVSEYGPIPEGYTLIPRPSVYHTWDGSQWVKTEENTKRELKDAIEQATDKINNVIASIYSEFTRFESEYYLREEQAKAFKEANHEGEVPVQVNAFAQAAGFPPQQATEIILGQAANLRNVLSELGALRMRKFELLSLTSLEAVQQKTVEILTAVKAAASKLQ